jgi:hypothetical protein
MKSAVSVSVSELVRQHAVSHYLSAARRRRDKTFSVNVGDVHKALELTNRVPQVCNALQSNKFLNENHIRLVSKTGPPSGLSTTVTYTYELLDGDSQNSTSLEPWLALRGIAKGIFASLGGGEAYIRGEREHFYGPAKDPLRGSGVAAAKVQGAKE